MSQLQALADVLVGCRVITRSQWHQAVRAGGGDLAQILTSLADLPPHWWDSAQPAPVGLTEYQRDSILKRFEASEIDLLGRDLALNQFLLLDKLGQGGQGEVFRARQLNPPRFAAVKTIIRDTEVRRHRFEQEARTMIKIRHSAVAQFYLYERVRDAGGEPTNEYLIAMELVHGIDLNRLVWRLGPVPWAFAARWTADILGGLAVIHQHGFIHRDVKPENVMALGTLPGPHTSPDNTAAKLLDFGAVGLAGRGPDDEPGIGKVFIGTVEYAPPEQWTGKVVAGSDVYALGGTLFFLLTGRSPYKLEQRDPARYRAAHTRAAIPDLTDHNPNVPNELNQLFRRMMAKDPSERGQAVDLRDEFLRLVGQETDPPSPPVIAATPPRAGPPKPSTRVAPTPRPVSVEPEPSGGGGIYHRVVDPALAILERVFIPGHLRPSRGMEAPLLERLAALLRRPLVLLTLAALISLVVWRLR